jgi:predicted permease
MKELLYILVHISLPIILLMGAGFGFQKIFKTDVRTFVKLQVYLIIPVMVFLRSLETEYTAGMLLVVTEYIMLLMAGLYIISRVYSALMRFPKAPATPPTM